MTAIAIAEDHSVVRNVILKIIKSLPGNIIVLEANNGFELLEQLSGIKKLPDIIIIDVNMPIMDGLFTTYFLSRNYPEIKIIAISTYTHPEIVIELFEAGAKAYLSKFSLTDKIFLQAFASIAKNEVFIEDSIENKEILIRVAEKRQKKAERKEPHVSLNDRELTFLQLSASSISYAQIAKLMNVANESVYNYQKSLKEKLGLSTRQELILYAIQHGIARIARLTTSSNLLLTYWLLSGTDLTVTI